MYRTLRVVTRAKDKRKKVGEAVFQQREQIDFAPVCVLMNAHPRPQQQRDNAIEKEEGVL